jgi:hypothetical protein
MAYNFMLVMANTGMRPPEARTLRWRDFDKPLRMQESLKWPFGDIPGCCRRATIADY